MSKYSEYFDSLAAQGIILTAGQKAWYEKKADVLQDNMKKEFPSTPQEAFETNTTGLYYAAHVSAARSSGRILNIPYDSTLRIHTAWDLGFSDANSIIFFTISGKEIHIIDYFEASGISLVEYIKQIKKRDYIYGTHLAPHDIRNYEYSTGVSRIDTAEKLGLHFVMVPNLPIVDGIDAVRNIFPRLFFHNSDAVLTFVHRIENYSQKWDRQLGIWSGRPEHDVSSHACFSSDTLVLTSLGNIRIDEIEKDDLVITPNGKRRVINIFKKKSNKLFKVSYKNREVYCTAEHEFFTKQGLIYADALSYNIPYTLEDMKECQSKYGSKSGIQTIGFRENFLSQKMRNAFTTMDFVIDGTEDISEQEKQNQGLFQHYTELFGQKITERFHKAIMCITKMEIQPTIIFQIWKLFLRRSMQSYILTSLREKKYLVRQLKLLCRPQKNGMEVKKGLNGTENMQKNMSSERMLCRWYANNAKKNLLVKFIIKYFAQMHAKQGAGTNPELITKSEYVRYAEVIMRSIATQSKKPVVQIVQYNFQEEQEVYDIEVEGDHCYYANGFLVSNSDALRYLAVGLNYCLEESQSVTQQQADDLWRQHARKM